MARATYLWVVFHDLTHALIGVWTVKHEMERDLETTWAGVPVDIHRRKDGSIEARELRAHRRTRADRS
jgi:hypothetical protein